MLDHGHQSQEEIEEIEEGEKVLDMEIESLWESFEVCPCVSEL